MKWLLIAAGTLVLCGAGVLLAAWSMPSTISISRAIAIHATPQDVFALVDNFHNWHYWAPQDREDPTMKRSFSGAQAGGGAISTWNSKGSAGSGQMMIVRSVANALVEVHVDFRSPFVAHNVNRFEIVPDGSATRITWTMHGTNIFLLKLVSVFASPEKILGPHFERGLSALKKAAEQRSKVGDRNLP